MTDSSTESWRPLVAITVGMCLLSTVEMHWLFFFVFIGFIAGLMFLQIVRIQVLQRRFWIETYLRKESPIRKWLANPVFLPYYAAALAIPLSIVTYISIYTYGLWDCLGISVAIFLAVQLQRAIASPVDANIAESLVWLVHFRVFYFFAILFILISIASISIGKGVFTDYSEVSSDQMATEVIDEYKHPVVFVRHCSRTLKYCELWLLKVRDINGWPYGWGIYLFFLFPNAIPALGIVTMYLGTEILFKVIEKQ